MRRIGPEIARAPNTARLPRTATMNRPMPRLSRLTNDVASSACRLRSSAALIREVVVVSVRRVHLGADRAGAVHQIDGVAIVLRRRGEFAGDGGIAFEQSGQPIQPFLIGRIVDGFHGGGDVCRRGRPVAIESADGAVDLARRDREANFAGFELHAARMVGGAQCVVGGALLAVRVGALQRGAIFADLLIAEHPGNQYDADGCPSGELGPNSTIPNRHRPALQLPRHD